MATSRTEILAAFFAAHPNQWIDGRALATVCSSFYGWRSRISDVRRPPFNLTIENRQRRVERDDGEHYIASEYRYVRAQPAAIQGHLLDLSL